MAKPSQKNASSDLFREIFGVVKDRVKGPFSAIFLRQIHLRHRHRSQEWLRLY